MALGPHVQGAIITAASVSFAHVTAAVALANDGDTVVIPAGAAEWDATLTITKAITIQGAGITGADSTRTIIKDNAPGPSGADSSIINLSTVAGKSYRITGIDFRQGTRTAEFTKGLIRIAGTSHAIRVDHCSFRTFYNRGITTNDWSLGVIDHCFFDNDDTAIHFSALTWGGYADSAGSWAANSSLGTADAFYVEDCTFTNSTGEKANAVDSEGGARWVLRNNTLFRGQMTTHGPEGGQDQGTRQFEIYNNDFGDGQEYTNAIHIRAGSGVIFNNTSSNYGKFCTLNYYPSRDNRPYFGIANGKRGWDINLPGGPFEQGVCTNQTTAAQMRDSTKTWAIDQWKGYSIINVTTGRAAPIMSNNESTITEWPAASQVADGEVDTNLLMQFHPGDRYEFWKIVNAMNMPGMGKGDLLPTNPYPPAPAHQIIEGIYAWDNTLDGSSSAASVVAPKYPFIKEGVHYFNNARKPGYAPFIYPHPLATGATVPQAPTNLRITPAH